MRPSTDVEQGRRGDCLAMPGRAPWRKPSCHVIEMSLREDPLCAIAPLGFEELRRLEREARAQRAEAVADGIIWLAQAPARILRRLAAAWQNGLRQGRGRLRPMP